ncbi:hypothetical protein F4825DRAFT_14554 [Nemania diffusa]|nr:hypothetical protein F4825DRAFT_14554 [Nemania diffusa]
MYVKHMRSALRLFTARLLSLVYRSVAVTQSSKCYVGDGYSRCKGDPENYVSPYVAIAGLSQSLQRSPPVQNFLPKCFFIIF